MTQPEDDFKNIIPVVLAGGEGRRLRPLTSRKTPKPFLRLRSPYTLLQETALRVRGLLPPAIVSAAALRERIVTDMKAAGVQPSQIFLEPEGRNTAPAIAAAAHYFAGCGGDPLLLVMPSDHAIGDPAALLDAVRRGIPLARAGKIVLFGVRPTRPETAYGYIERGAETAPGIFDVSSFREKPGPAAAKKFFRDGRHDWNSGIFLFSAACFLNRLRQADLDLYENTGRAVMGASRLQNCIFLERSAFCACPAAPVDRAVLEKTGDLAAIPVDMGWRDLGRWPDLIRYILRAG